MNTQVTRGAGTILVTNTGMTTEVGHISGMLHVTKDEVTPLTRQLNALTNQILVIAGVALLISIGIGLWREHPDRRAVPDRDRVRRVGHPDRPAGGGHGDPVEGHDDARLGRRHRQAAALGRDARLDLGDQLRQDRHADAQPDDRRPDGRRPRSLRDHRRGLLHRGPDHPRGRPGRGTAGFAAPADGAVRRRRDPRRRAGRRPDRRRARRPRGEGRGRPDPHPRALPARRDPPVRRRVQVHGDVPPDDR